MPFFHIYHLLRESPGSLLLRRPATAMGGAATNMKGLLFPFLFSLSFSLILLSWRVLGGHVRGSMKQSNPRELGEDPGVQYSDINRA